MPCSALRLGRRWGRTAARALAPAILIGGGLLPGCAWAAHPGRVIVAHGDLPSVAYDANGTAYLADNATPPGSVTLASVCVLPSGRLTCSTDQLIGESAPAGGGLGQIGGDYSAPVIAATGAGQLSVAYEAGQYYQNFVTTSANRGETFSTPVTFAGSADDYGFTAGAWGPGGSLLLASDPDTGSLNETLGTVANPPVASAQLATGYIPGATAGWSGTTAVVVGGGPYTRVFVDSGRGDPNVGTSWRAERLVGTTSDPRLVGGRGGLYLLQSEQNGLGGPTLRLVVRRFGAHGAFGAPHVAMAVSDRSSGSLEDATIAESPSGVLLLAWYEHGQFFARVSRDRGLTWSKVRYMGSDAAPPDAVAAALGPDDRGLIVYSTGADHTPVRGFALDTSRFTVPVAPRVRRRRHQAAATAHVSAAQA